MKKNFVICFLAMFFLMSGQNIGINTTIPSATLDIVSKGNTNATNALNIKNSSSSNLLTTTDQGNVGLNLGSTVPASVLQVNSAATTNIRHENLPVLASPAFTPPFNSLGISTNGNGVGMAGIVKYMYYQNSTIYPSTYNSTTNTGGFSLYNVNEYTNIPVKDNSDLKGNTLGFTFGTDASATVNGQAVSNVGYMIVPEPGVYLFEFYGTTRCDRYNNTQNYTLSGQMQVNTVFAAATGSTYTTNTIFRGMMTGQRNDNGNTHNNTYGVASPQTLTVALQTTQTNQKVGLFVQYASGESNQFSNQECFFNVPAGANFSYYLIVTKM